ncbi:MAG: preprotein translocase subunit SecG [Anaerolineales bacterium]|nr:preprotein translocase subunit SecG [Anaerolineales bacterium]
MQFYLDLVLVIISVALITVILLQSKGAGLGGLGGGGGGDFGGGSGYHVRRGLERVMFYVTIGLSVVFFTMAVVTVVLVG